MSMHLMQRLEKASLAARYSNINWAVDTKPRILAELDRLKLSSEEFRAKQIPREENAIQINIFSDRIFPKVNSEAEYERDSPAALVISVHPNGSVCFSASGFSSSHSSLPRDSYILGLYADANELGGLLGSHRIRRHISEFAELALLSMTETRPTRSSAKFIDRLEERTRKFRPLHENLDQQRRAEASQNVAIAGGLIAGLISSAVLPMSVSVGMEARDRAAKILSACQDAFNKTACLDGRDYSHYKLAADALSPENVMLASLLLSFFALVVVYRFIRR